MHSITLDELTADGAEFFRHLAVGHSCTVTQSDRILALVIGMNAAETEEPRPADCYAGQINIAPDFNEPLPDWDEALERPVI